MSDRDLVKKTAKFVKKKSSTDNTGHDWWHIYRVWQLAKHIAKEEKPVNLTVVELAALLHDIADFKFHKGDLEAGPRAAREWLSSINTPDEIVEQVEDIVRHISFKGAAVKNILKTKEGRIVHDADKLDAIGAIGIARVFAYGSSQGRLIYDPVQQPVLHETLEQYVNNNSSSINHFHEKLLLLKDRMYTKTGKTMAKHRHRYLENFLEEFHKEWEGKL